MPSCLQCSKFSKHLKKLAALKGALILCSSQSGLFKRQRKQCAGLQSKKQTRCTLSKYEQRAHENMHTVSRLWKSQGKVNRRVCIIILRP